MQAFLKLTKVWPWLPHFRVVAEVESLSRAARRFGMTSAALSKAIRTLEKLLGVQLFDRAGGKLRLNEQGRALLVAVRANMRDIDDAITSLRARTDALRIAVDPALATVVLSPWPASLEILDVPAEIAPSLLRGDVDAVVHVGAVVNPELDSQQIANLARGLFVARAVPARSVAALVESIVESIADRAAPFPVVSLDDPSRREAVTTASLAHAIAWVTSGSGAAVLPCTLATRLGLQAVELETELPALPLWATVRRARGAPGAAFAWREDVRVRCAAI